MKKLLITVAMCALASRVESDELSTGGIQFTVDYAHMCTMALDERDAGRAALDLMKMDEAAMEWVAKFWHAKFLFTNGEAIERLAKDHANQIDLAKTEADRAKLKSEFPDRISFVKMTFYYDHFDQINAMIQTRIRCAERGESHKLGSKEEDAKRPELEEPNLPRVKDP